MGKHANLKERSKSGLRKSSILKTHENCVGSVSSTPLIRNSKKPSRTHVRSWKNHHEDHIAGKGEKSLQHYNLVHKFIPMPQAMKIPAEKAAVDKKCDKFEKILAWNLTKVRSKKQVIDEARTKKGATVHFASLMYMSSEKC